MNGFYKEVLEDMVADIEYDTMIPQDELDDAIDILDDDGDDVSDNVVENKSYKDKINEQRENNGLMAYYENLELSRNIDKEMY